MTEHNAFLIHSTIQRIPSFSEQNAAPTNACGNCELLGVLPWAEIVRLTVLLCCPWIGPTCLLGYWYVGFDIRVIDTCLWLLFFEVSLHCGKSSLWQKIFLYGYHNSSPDVISEFLICEVKIFLLSSTALLKMFLATKNACLHFLNRMQPQEVRAGTLSFVLSWLELGYGAT